MTLLPKVAVSGFGTRCKVFSTPKHNDIFRILLSGYYFLKQAEYPSIHSEKSQNILERSELVF